METAARKPIIEEILWGDKRNPVRFEVAVVADFLEDLVVRRKLPIADSEGGRPSALASFGPGPCFLVAKTGVGKTLAIPVLELLHACASGPRSRTGRRRVYVVEPRIPICIDQQRFMSLEFDGFCERRGIIQRGSLFGAVTSATGTIERDAPIQFVTTGILESMTAAGKLDPGVHRVLIDEAHVTLAQNPGIEFAVAKARRLGVSVSYMSATVDITGLADELGVDIVTAGVTRYPVLLRLFDGIISRADQDASRRSITTLVNDLLVAPSRSAIPSVSGSDAARMKDLEDVRDTLTDGAQGRAVGMLFVVNSFQSERADTAFVADIIRNAPFNSGTRRVEVLSLASAIVRDAHANAAFRRRLAEIEARCGRYVIVATNVVEMGLTFESIDIVVTLDSELRTVSTPHGSMLIKSVLPVNALYQRAGRAGRLRPGICFIVRDVEAPYTKLSPEQLDAGLAYGRLEYPLEHGNVSGLAAASFRDGTTDLASWLTELPLPSRLRHGVPWIERAVPELERGRQELIDLQLADDGALTPRGELGDGALYEVEVVRLVAALLDAIESDASDVVAALALVAAAPSATIDDWITVPARVGWDEAPRVRQVLEIPAKSADVAHVLDVVQAGNPGVRLASALVARGLGPAIAHRLGHLYTAGWRVADTTRAKNEFIEVERVPFRLSIASESVALYDVAVWVDGRFGALLALEELAPTDRQAIRRRAEEECRGLGIAFTNVQRCVSVARRLLRRIAKLAKRRDLEIADGSRLPPLKSPLRVIEHLVKRGFLERHTLRFKRAALQGAVQSAGKQWDVSIARSSTCLLLRTSDRGEATILARVVLNAGKAGLVASLAHRAVFP